MIDVKRVDYPERVFHLRNGKEKVRPASYEVRYFYNGKEIAWYYSTDDVLYLKTCYLERDWNKTVYERAISGSMAEIFEYLFDMLKVTRESCLSEYMSA